MMRDTHAARQSSLYFDLTPLPLHISWHKLCWFDFSMCHTRTASRVKSDLKDYAFLVCKIISGSTAGEQNIIMGVDFIILKLLGSCKMLI